jgi:S1-C subfamily serine protease
MNDKLMMLILMMALAAPLPAVADTTPAPEERGADRIPESELAEARRALAEAARRVAELSVSEADRVVREMDFQWVTAPRVRLGVTIDEHEAGIAVASVAPDSPAAAAGLRAGDVLTELNGRPLTPADGHRQFPVMRIREALEGVDPGDEVTLKYRRGRQNRTATVTVVEAPRGIGTFAFGSGDGRRMIEIPGLPPLPPMAVLRPMGDYEFVRVNESLGRYFGTERGLLVVRTGDDNPLGLREGDVILNIGGREPSSPTQAARILRSYEPGESLTLDIMRDRERMTLEVTVPHPARTGWRTD